MLYIRFITCSLVRTIMISPCSKLGCQEGRSAASWVDYSLYGHQIVCHEIKGYNAAASHNAVDGDPVPVPHFGMALKVDQFHALADRVAKSGIKFVIEPHLRFEGEIVLASHSTSCSAQQSARKACLTIHLHMYQDRLCLIAV